MNAFLIAVFVMTAIGLACSAILSAVSRIMAVPVDGRVEQIIERLPGADCGACGYPGCAGYAAALIEGGGVKSNLCAPGGTRVAELISAVLGVQAERAAIKRAVVHCGGDCDTVTQTAGYAGIESCAAAKRVYGGSTDCAFGCLGFGDCKSVCPSGAIRMEKGLARVDAGLCTGCGLCVKTCPNRLISVEEDSAVPVVLCSNHERAKAVWRKCKRGCLGDGKCARACPSGAITVIDNLASIDYSKCNCDELHGNENANADAAASNGAIGIGGIAAGIPRCVKVCSAGCIKPRSGAAAPP